MDANAHGVSLVANVTIQKAAMSMGAATPASVRVVLVCDASAPVA
jgi:hypothetical protein